MVNDYGIKVSQPGYDVKTCDPQYLVFSSKYPTLRVFTQGNGQILNSTGRTVTITHGLGYVPAFLVHSRVDAIYAAGYFSSDDFFINPLTYPAGGCHIERDVVSWADTDKLYIKCEEDFGNNYYSTGNLGIGGPTTDYSYSLGGAWGGSGTFAIGRKSGENYEGAIRFRNVTIAKNEAIVSADLLIYCGSVTGNQTIRHRFSGIDEDNTADFSGNPFGRTRTTAGDNFSYTISGTPTYISVGCQSIIEEITTRAGWASGNAIGFIFKAEGTDSDNNTYITTTAAQDWGFYCSQSYLKIVKVDLLTDYKYTIFLAAGGI